MNFVIIMVLALQGMMTPVYFNEAGKFNSLKDCQAAISDATNTVNQEILKANKEITVLDTFCASTDLVRVE